MIEKQKSLLQTEETEKVSKKPLSNEELSSLIKASNNKKFNEAELKVKKNENESFKKITLHDIAKQMNQQNQKESIYSIQAQKQKEQEYLIIQWRWDKGFINPHHQNLVIKDYPEDHQVLILPQTGTVPHKGQGPGHLEDIHVL